jgi:hypothetical protein
LSSQSVIGSDKKKIKYTNARVVTTIATTACICSLRDQLRRTSTNFSLLLSYGFGKSRVSNHIPVRKSGRTKKLNYARK